ncbi:MAG: OmpA family protein [Parvularculaceae bacterium]|nr:OmpA family protein [Parvularculaceae bacterium]
MRKQLSLVAIALGALSQLAPSAAFATPEPKGVGLQPANSPIAESIHFFHNAVLLPIITVICLFVLALLIWVFIRYNSKANPVPKKFSHNTLLEVVWTVIPIAILLVIALFSFDLLFKENIIPDGKQTVATADGSATTFQLPNTFPERRRLKKPGHVDVFLVENGQKRKLAAGADYTLAGFGTDAVTATLKSPPPSGAQVVMQGGRTRDHHENILLAPSLTINAKGYQWQWSYAYPEFGIEEFFSKMLPKEQTTKELYLLETDNRMVVPVGETVRVITQAADVIHSWALPAFGVKVDAVPGRNNEIWFRADREGVYYGQCSEICGVGHAFMPIAVDVKSRGEFERWVDGQRTQAGLEPMFGKVAAAPASVKEAAAPAAAPIVSAELKATIDRCQTELDALAASETINFATGRSEIPASSRPFLDKIAGVAKTCVGPVITVGGHTDASGNEAANVRLSTSRAEAVRTYLVDAGFAADRIAAVGFGSGQPVADNATREGRAKNRRIAFVVSAPAVPATTTTAAATSAGPSPQPASPASSAPQN